MNRMTRHAVVLYLITCFWIASPAVAYDPPVGIPNPADDWGGTIDPIDDPVPDSAAVCPGWPAADSNCFYIDNAAACSDAGQGSPNTPRCTVPDGITLSAGQYMEIHGGAGPYTDTDTHNIAANGTSTQPVWIVGKNNPALRCSGNNHALAVSGSYYLVDGVSLDRSVQGFAFAFPTDRGVFRNAVIVGDGSLLSYGGSQISSSGIDSGNENNYVVVYNITMSEIGQWDVDDNTDAHGIKFRNNINHAWILDSDISHCQGDSVQTGEGSITGDDAPTHIYIGGNTFYENKENGIDIKDGSDIILSHNTIFDMANAYGDDADEGIVIHEEADHIWAINNRIYNCGIGMITTISTNTWFIGNTIYDIDGSTDPQSHYGLGVGIHFRGNSSGGVINNTIVNCDKGIQLTSIAGGFQCRNNIISHRSDASAFDLMAQSAGNADADYHLLYAGGSSRILWGGAIYTSVADFNAGSGQCANCPAEADPRYANAADANFALESDAPAIGKGESHAIYTYYASRYGVSINRDQAGTVRPQNGTWDIGAFEYDEGAPPPTPGTNPDPGSGDSDDSSGGCFLSIVGCP